MDPKNVKEILEWIEPMSAAEVISFHGFVSFYRKFIRSFSGINAHFIECMKKGYFKWTTTPRNKFADQRNHFWKFQTLKEYVKWTVMQARQQLGKLSQEGRPLAFFNENLIEAKKNNFVWSFILWCRI